MSPKQIKLVSVMALAISILIALGVTLDVGHTAPTKPLRAKLWQSNSDISKPNAAEKEYLRKHAVTQEERKFEDEIPKPRSDKVQV